MVLSMAYVIDREVMVNETICRVDLETIRMDEGGKSKTISLTGHRSQNWPQKVSTVEGVVYRRLVSGKLTLRTAIPDMFLKPGDTVRTGKEEFTAGSVSITVNTRQATMEVTEG
jgi:IS4 transposase